MTEPQKDPELIAIVPVEMSMSGRNSHYFFCHRRQQQVSYAVCLHTVKAIEDDRKSGHTFDDCQRAYCHNDCEAKVMKAQEISAGHALFYKERVTPVAVKAKSSAADGAVSSGKYDMSNPSYARGWAIGGREGYSTDKPVPKRQSPKPTRNIGPIKKSGFVEEGMADVVNVLMKEHEESKSVPKPKVAETPATDKSSTRPLPGESTADFIKRRAALKAGK